MGDGPSNFTGAFRIPRSVVVQEVSDDEEAQVLEIDEDRTYTTEYGSSTERPTSMNANHIPASPSTPPSASFHPPPPPFAGVNSGTSWVPRDPSAHAMTVQSRQSPATTWYNAVGMYRNNSRPVVAELREDQSQVEDNRTVERAAEQRGKNGGR
jgi:hypothetical protein